MVKIILFILLIETAFSQNDFILTILHTGDLHAKFEPKINKKGEAIGGFGQIMTYIEQERRTASQDGRGLIYLDAGDIFTGSLWFVVHSTNITADFRKQLNMDAQCVGNHEFDKGVDALVDYLIMCDTKLLCSNCDVSNEERLQDMIIKSKILTISNRKILIIGYINKHLATTAKFWGNLTLTDENISIKQEIDTYKGNGVNIVILVGHAGLQNDKEVAANIDGIDIIVGGHSHSFLYSGKKKPELPVDGVYPTIVRNRKGENVYIVHSGYHTYYVGKLNVVFDRNGRVISAIGEPQLMVGYKQHIKAIEILDKYRHEIERLAKTKVGKSAVFLDGDHGICRSQECNIGNLVTDALIYFKAALNTDETVWSPVGVAFINGGLVRHSIAPNPKDKSITYADILNSFPFNNVPRTVRINGSVLNEVIQHSILKINRPPGKFLQVSGLKIVYDNSSLNGSVFSVRARCSQCLIPTYEPVSDSEIYNISTTDYLADGEDKYSMLIDTAVDDGYHSYDLVQIIVDYIQSQTFVAPEIEERIVILNKEDANKMFVSCCQLYYEKFPLLHRCEFILIIYLTFTTYLCFISSTVIRLFHLTIPLTLQISLFTQ